MLFNSKTAYIEFLPFGSCYLFFLLLNLWLIAFIVAIVTTKTEIRKIMVLGQTWKNVKIQHAFILQTSLWWTRNVIFFLQNANKDACAGFWAKYHPEEIFVSPAISKLLKYRQKQQLAHAGQRLKVSFLLHSESNDFGI